MRPVRRRPGTGACPNVRRCVRVVPGGAVTFSRPLTHYSIQVKGVASGVRPSTEADRVVQERYRAAYTEQLHAVGLPRAVAKRIAWWPSVAIDISVRDLFVQTPGPSAGRRLET